MRSKGQRSGTGADGTATGSGRGARAPTSAAEASGATARARLGSVRTARVRTRRQTDTTAADVPIAEPTVTADDAVLAASNTERALSPDMPRVAWLRTQLMQLEARQRDRLVRVLWLILIAIVFIAFVLQNAQPVDVHFLPFSANIRLIWVIFGCALLGGVAGFLIGRPDRNLQSLFPHRARRDSPEKKRAARRGPGVAT